jgi:hypothetical protein
MAQRTRRLITIAQAAKLAGCSPRQMRRRLRTVGGRVLVRQSASPRARLWVDVKALQRSGCDWLDWVEPVDALRVREIVQELMKRQTEIFGHALTEILQRMNEMEERLNGLALRPGRGGTK